MNGQESIDVFRVAHLLLSYECFEELVEEAGVEFVDDLVAVVGIPEGEVGVVCEAAGFFGDGYREVELVVGLEETVSPGAHLCWCVVIDFEGCLDCEKCLSVLRRGNYEKDGYEWFVMCLEMEQVSRGNKK